MSKAPNVSAFYKVGGALPHDVPSYVTRKSDRELYEALKAREFCYVLNSRQMGKTSLMVRTLAKLQSDDWAGIIIDFSAKDSQVDKPDQWYDGIINQLNRHFSLLNRSAFRSWLKERDFIAPVERLAEFIETMLLPSSERPIVIFIDEIDSTLGLPFTDDFFALIRAYYNRRAENPGYQRLTFALLGVAAPSELIGDAKRTPFNIGKSIDLKGFSFEEALHLASGLEGNAEQPEVVLSEILHWTGGQPFLTQRLCQLVADVNVKIPLGKESSQVRQLVKSCLIENWEAQDHQEHLKTIQRRLLDNEQKAGYLLELYRQILQTRKTPAANQLEERELQLSGLVVKRNNQLRVYNPIYAAVFDEDWIDIELQKLRPYSENLRAWIASKCQDESRLLRGQALENAQAWAMGKNLGEVDYRFLRASEKSFFDEQKLTYESIQRELRTLQKRFNSGQLEQTTIQQILQLLQSSAVLLITWKAGSKTAKVICQVTQDNSVWLKEDHAIPIDTDAILNQAIQYEGILHLKDYKLPPETQQWFSAPDHSPILLMALRTAPEHIVTGVLVVVMAAKSQLTDYHLLVLELLTNQLAWSKRHVDLVAMLSQQRRELENLNWYKHQRLEDLHRHLGKFAQHLDRLKNSETDLKSGLEILSSELTTVLEDTETIVMQEQWQMHNQHHSILLTSLLNHLMDRIKPILDARQLWCKVHNESNVLLEGDSLKIELILYEVIAAACHRSPRGARVDIWCRSLTLDWFELSTTDDGTISDELLDELNPERLSDLLAPSMLDSPPGLHLSICQTLTDQLGGEMDVRILDDGRTHCRFILPLIAQRS